MNTIQNSSPAFSGSAPTPVRRYTSISKNLEELLGLTLQEKFLRECPVVSSAVCGTSWITIGCKIQRLLPLCSFLYGPLIKVKFKLIGLQLSQLYWEMYQGYVHFGNLQLYLKFGGNFKILN